MFTYAYYIDNIKIPFYTIDDAQSYIKFTKQMDVSDFRELSRAELAKYNIYTVEEKNYPENEIKVNILGYNFDLVDDGDLKKVVVTFIVENKTQEELDKIVEETKQVKSGQFETMRKDLCEGSHSFTVEDKEFVISLSTRTLALFSMYKEIVQRDNAYIVKWKNDNKDDVTNVWYTISAHEFIRLYEQITLYIISQYNHQSELQERLDSATIDTINDIIW